MCLDRGSKSAAAHFDELGILKTLLWQKTQKQQAPTTMELVERTKKLKSGAWCNDKARNYAVGFNEKKDDAISRASQSQDEVLTGEGPALLSPLTIMPFIWRSSGAGHYQAAERGAPGEEGERAADGGPDCTVDLGTPTADTNVHRARPYIVAGVGADEDPGSSSCSSSVASCRCSSFAASYRC